MQNHGFSTIGLVARSVAAPAVLAALLAVPGLGAPARAEGPTVEALLQQARVGSDPQKHQAFIALERLGPEGAPAVPALLEMLTSDKTFTVKVRSPMHHLGPNQTFWLRDRAAEVLMKIGGPAVPELIRCATQDAKRAKTCVFCLVAIAQGDRRFRADQDPGVGKVLAGLVDQHRASLSVSELRALAGAGCAPAGAELIARLDSPQWQERGWAAIGLGELGEAGSIPKLASLLAGDPSDFVRQYSAKALGQLQASAALEPLIQAALHDRARDTRRAAVEALAALRVKRGIESVTSLLATDPSAEVRLECARTFWTVRYPAAIPPLIAALQKEEDYLTRDYLLHALWKQRAVKAIPEIERVIADPKRQLSHHIAEYALKVLGGGQTPQDEFATLEPK